MEQISITCNVRFFYKYYVTLLCYLTLRKESQKHNKRYCGKHVTLYDIWIDKRDMFLNKKEKIVIHVESSSVYYYNLVSFHRERKNSALQVFYNRFRNMFFFQIKIACSVN